MKVRSTGAVVRYNWFNSAHRTLDLVEAQDAFPNWMYENYSNQEILEYYRTSYVYGNVFVNDHSATSGQPAGRPLHFGADSLDEPPVFGGSGPAGGQPAMRGYQSPTYFYHNTFYMRASTSDMWRGSLFDLENNNSPGATSTPGQVDAWNNIIEFLGDTRIGAANRSGTRSLSRSQFAPHRATDGFRRVGCLRQCGESWKRSGCRRCVQRYGHQPVRGLPWGEQHDTDGEEFHAG